MSGGGAAGIIGGAVADLRRKWEQTRQYWDDANAERFEADYIEALEQKVRVAIDAMDKLSAMQSQATRACE